MTSAQRARPGREAPPDPAPGALRIVALGGIKEIGRNMTMFEQGGRLLVVDCGMLLGKTNSPGVDITLPDWSAFADRLDDIDAVVLTHGHEDHIGALPYLLRQRRDIPVLGSRLTLALVAAKLEQHRIKADLRTVIETERLTIGPWDLEFFAVNHSIPDALAVAIRVGGQTVLHTGDFKMDQTPLDGRLTDLPGFSRLGDEGVDLLLADSTNAEVGGFIPSERDVGQVVDDVIAKARGRIIVACFASHVHRVQQVLDAAAEAQRAGGPRRPVDGAQHADRPGTGAAAGARRPDDRPEDRRGTAVAAGAADLHRVAGRAALGAVADGQPGSPDGADRAR